ncbi:hypothetical protein BD410DRAFT_744417 [Rickenella mellea]|uniref:Uncharacterized protein n=1 Tax=Rickenella mellea TaxID=50990 RepID=A0A4Y7QC32_9AGAM|nr:hypothetical protein BD410DRAFT_744417 [Rickenella mellea]
MALARSSRLLRIALPTNSRCFRCTVITRDLVGPPDPLSNLRPVRYDGDKFASSDKDVEPQHHPYSLEEFDGDPIDYQWRLERQRLDASNHAFWAESNRRFEEAKWAVLYSLPEDAPPLVREAALSEFYGKWLAQEQQRQKEYTDEWRRKNISAIVLGARIAMRRFRARVRDVWSQSKDAKGSS